MLITDRTADQNVRFVPEADIADIRIRSKFLFANSQSCCRKNRY